MPKGTMNADIDACMCLYCVGGGGYVEEQSLKWFIDFLSLSK